MLSWKEENYLMQCVDLVDRIITAERLGKVASEESKISSKIDFINEMRNELLCFSKGDL